MTENGRYKKKNTAVADANGETEKRRWKAKFAAYINFTPTEAHKERFAEWLYGRDLWVEYAVQLGKGRRFSVEYDLYSQCYTASCFERDQDSPNAGLVATGRGADPDTAVWRCLYYVSDVFPENWRSVGVIKNEDLW